MHRRFVVEFMDEDAGNLRYHFVKFDERNFQRILTALAEFEATMDRHLADGPRDIKVFGKVFEDVRFVTVEVHTIL